jgi:hypothetical protein
MSPNETPWVASIEAAAWSGSPAHHPKLRRPNIALKIAASQAVLPGHHPRHQTKCSLNQYVMC